MRLQRYHIFFNAPNFRSKNIACAFFRQNKILSIWLRGVF
ncbi:nitrate reductase [Prevotella dentalis DSM 3688]|uniref:Nitrate reductase n=1 Tax=Prevotella dentalis (strain ATCC 49559 / DSM 3688 / JCM 13448 / NCTC 12043 / ES 2772) TaxID=908937 RepID=F9D069_PREDD|nr:nitrate reductase [Prevotella dentalis DSM 3688]